MPMTFNVPGRGDVTLGVIFQNAGAPTTTSFLGIAGLGDFYVNTTAGSVALYLCTAVTASAITWTQITVP